MAASGQKKDDTSLKEEEEKRRDEFLNKVMEKGRLAKLCLRELTEFIDEAKLSSTERSSMEEKVTKTRRLLCGIRNLCREYGGLDGYVSDS